MGKLLRRFAAIIASVLVVALAEPAVSRSVNINNSWLLPQNDFPVFYRHFRDRITWFEADAVCQFHHAQLVTVETNTQFETIRDYLKELDVTENVWIGLKRNSEASEFAWTNYQPLARGGFFREEVPSSENPVCVVTDPTANFKWHSLHCGGPEVASFVCELPVPYWASKSNGCIASTTKDMTVTFLPEEPAIQFVNECGDGITNKVTCKGNMKSSEIMENLTCPYSNAPSLKTILKSTSAEIITTTSSSESDLEDYAIEMATISQYNDETFQSLSKVIGRGLPQEMSIDQEPIKGTRSGFNTNGINSSVMGGVSETGTDVVSSTTVGTLNTTITQSTITIAPSTSNDPNTTIALNATTGIPITTTIAPNTTNHGLQGTTYQMPITTPSTKTTTITAEKPEQATTFTAETKATGSAVTTAERTPPIVQGSIFTTVPVSTVIRDTLAIKPRTTVTVDTIATSAAPTATATSTTMHSTTTKTAGRRHHHHGHHTSSPTFATTTEKIRTIAKIMAADQQPPSITPTTYAVTRLAEYVLRTTTATTRTTTGRPLFVSTSSPKIPYTMAIGRPMQTATPLANARVPITGSSDMAPVTTTPTSVGDVTTVAQHYRRFKKIDFPQMPLDDDYPFPYKPTPLVRTTTPIATTPTVTTTTPTVTTTTPTVTTTTRTVTTTTPKIKTTTPTVTTNITDSTAATINNTGYYAAINTGEIARRTSVKTIDVPHSTLKSVTTNTITTVTQTETTPAGRNDTTFATTSVMASTSTISDENDWNQIMNSSSQALPITTTDNKTGTTATTAPVVTTGHHKINYDTYTDHPSRSRHIIRPKQQHHHSYPYILYRLLG